MKLVTVRRISQVFFLALFVWFCLVTTLGRDWWQLRGWPVNWFMQLDPLLGLATALATGALYAGLAWGLLTVGLTLVLGRFFCGWVCPLGALNQFIGWLAFKRKPLKQKLAASSPGPGRNVKYYLLAFLLAAAGAGLPLRLLDYASQPWPWVLVAVGLACVLGLTLWQLGRKALWPLLAGLIVWSGLCLWLGRDGAVLASLQSGLLDPIPLLQRSVNVALLPLLDSGAFGAGHRLYAQGGLILGVLLAVLGLNFLRPRFYCRYVCPLGALFGVLGRFSFYSLGKKQEPCLDCRLCVSSCQGASDPAGALAKSECLLCLNCREACPEGVLDYRAAPSAAGEAGTDLDRRRLVGSFLGGAMLAPALRLVGLAGIKTPGRVRPPGTQPEELFLAACTKCGQCMRICPTGVIQPAGLQAGLEGLWTPVMDFRRSAGGCLPGCVACGHLCPTAAIRPLNPEERRGLGDFARAGPVKIGTAFINQSRCLPWAMDRPCIVCQENCPVSPKAIMVREVFQPLAQGEFKVAGSKGNTLNLDGPGLKPGALSGGDYYGRVQGAPGEARRLIKDNGQASLTLAVDAGAAKGSGFVIEVRLQRPVIDPAACIGCGACESVCPLRSGPAITVCAENETRSKVRTLLGGIRQ